MRTTSFGVVGEGREAFLYTVANANGVEMTVSNLGAELINVLVLDREGKKRDVVLGYDNLAAYVGNTNSYLGATVGRSANRIVNAAFELNGKTYHLTANEGLNNLHSGPDGYQIRLWETADTTQNSVTFCLNSPDGDQGYPGNLDLCVTYTLTDENELKITYEGTSDADTILNPTNHTYFNLGGHKNGTVLEHVMTICAHRYTPVCDKASIPTGELAEVAGTPFDFLTGKTIGRDIDADFEQLVLTGGYDHNFVLDKEEGKMGKAARVTCEESGITMECSTDLPGVQFYAGNFLKDEPGKDGAVYGKRNGFCLETQYFPNSVNEAAFTSPLLKAGEKFCSQTVYRFEVNA